MLSGRTPLILAGVFALLAAMVAFLALRQKTQEIEKGWDPVAVMAAAGDLSPGEELSTRNLRTQMIPSRMVTDSVVTAAANARLPVFGTKIAVPMREGDVLLWSHLHTKASDQKLSQSIQKGARAVSIRVSPESAVHHWIEPGDVVDVVGLFRDPKAGEMSTFTLLQNITVLATGRIGGRTNRRLLTGEDASYSTVTLHVAAEAAEALILGQQLGSLYLTLRNAEDTELFDTEKTQATMKTLLTGERKQRITKAQSRIQRVEIIRGGSKETQTIR